MSKKYLTVKEISETLGVSKVAVYQWLKEGLPHKKERTIGKKEYVVATIKDVEKHLKLTKK